MGRNESDDLSAAQIFYPCMQCADIFFLKADICQLGMDQRKVGERAVGACVLPGRGGAVPPGHGHAQGGAVLRVHVYERHERAVPAGHGPAQGGGLGYILRAR